MGLINRYGWLKPPFYRERPVLVIQSKMDTVGLVQVLTKYQETEEIILDLEEVVHG